MFANRTVNPSPNRTSIKEANDHLQLLHERVVELEKTTQEQTEALKKKDELYQTTMKELTELKNAEIEDLNSVVSQLRDRVSQLEHLVREKDQQIEQLTQRCGVAEDIASFTPSVEKLLAAMRKVPYNKPAKHNSKPRTRPSRPQNSKPDRKSSFDAGHVHEMTNNIDGHGSSHNQSFSDLRIARSFNINSNFSMSEDDDQMSEIL